MNQQAPWKVSVLREIERLSMCVRGSTAVVAFELPNLKRAASVKIWKDQESEGLQAVVECTIGGCRKYTPVFLAEQVTRANFTGFTARCISDLDHAISVLENELSPPAAQALPAAPRGPRKAFPQPCH